MRAEAWSGLATNASPFALPPGAAVKQVNLCTHIPGQLTLRGGMRPVAFSDESLGGGTPFVSLATYTAGGGSGVLALLADGKLHALPLPDRGDPLAAPEPVSLDGDGFSASYTQAISKGE
jgi:hypothetical protein